MSRESFSDLTSSKLREVRYTDSIDPMSSAANMVDVMLVFACGLMLALITYWNVDVSTKTEVLKQDEVTEIADPEDVTDALTAQDGTAYVDMGKVYMDPTTGKYYMITSGQAEMTDQDEVPAQAQAIQQGISEQGK